MMLGTPNPFENKGLQDARLSRALPRRDELCPEKWWRACSLPAIYTPLLIIYVIHLFTESYKHQRMVLQGPDSGSHFDPNFPDDRVIIDFGSQLRFPPPAKRAPAPA